MSYFDGEPLVARNTSAGYPIRYSQVDPHLHPSAAKYLEAQGFKLFTYTTYYNPKPVEESQWISFKSIIWAFCLRDVVYLIEHWNGKNSRWRYSL